MSNRLPHAQSADLGLVAWLEHTRVSLPLKVVECRFDVIGGIADVRIDQVFHQTFSQPLDCTYTFPLPARAAVYRCLMHVNGRTIAARIESREDAVRIFREKLAAGHRAALVETERENLFTLTLGNVQPGDVVVIELAYFQTLERMGEGLSLRVPVCPGVRYIPGQPLLRSLSGRGSADDTDQVPDASRISPPRIDAMHPDAAVFAMTGTLGLGDAQEGTLSSPSHPVLVRADGAQWKVTMADAGAVPDRDMVLRWREPKDATLVPRAYRYVADGKQYALVQLRAPEEVGTGLVKPRDYYFLIDRSGSMGGAKWEKACAALVAFVRQLQPDDRVWITLFESESMDFAEKPQRAAVLLQDPAFHRLAEIPVGGGTEMLPAMKHVIDKVCHFSDPADATLLLLTDGQVGNEAAVLRAAGRLGQLTIHTFGIDTAMNDALLRKLAESHGGECWLLTPDDDIEAAVVGVGSHLRRPVLTEVEVRSPWSAAATRQPGLYAGQVAEWSLSAKGTRPESIQITGVGADGKRATYEVQPVETTNQAIALLWARQEIASLESRNKRSAALKVAKQFNLLCEGAAFIAWDETERVAIADREIYQPSMEVGTLQQQDRVFASMALHAREDDDLLFRSHFSLEFFSRPEEPESNPSPDNVYFRPQVVGRVPLFVADEFVRIAGERFTQVQERVDFFGEILKRFDAAEDRAAATAGDRRLGLLEECLAMLREFGAGEECLRRLEEEIAQWRAKLVRAAAP